MGILREFEKIKGRTFVLAFLCFLFLFLPGVAFLFLYQRDVFMLIDWVKLLLLSASFSAPVSVVNGMAFSYVGDFKPEEEESLFSSMVLGIVITGFVLSSVVFVSYLFNEPLRHFVIPLLVAEVALIGVVWVREMRKKKQK